MTTSALAAAMMLGSVSAMAGDTQSCANLGNKYFAEVAYNVEHTDSEGYSPSGYGRCIADVSAKRIKMKNSRDCKTKMRLNIWAATSAQQSIINKFYTDGVKKCNTLI